MCSLFKVFVKMIKQGSFIEQKWGKAEMEPHDGVLFFQLKYNFLAISSFIHPNIFILESFFRHAIFIHVMITCTFT